jgi:eukaryotic-like serine/threonine-protein kinase
MRPAAPAGGAKAGATPKPQIGSGKASVNVVARTPAPQPQPQPEPPYRAQTPGGGAPVRAQLPAAGSGPNKPKVALAAKPRGPVVKDADMYIGQVLNGRFRIDSKIGEGGFGAVYRGVQLATGRKVALKLLHPEMTNDENLVARFRREGLVLCNLRDAHTITTYDFDQTPDGTLYIAMELLEGRSLHQVFHDEAPVDWRRMFKVLTEMCSSLAEAHAQGIVHRDLKPENIYLENRPGNPEFVKILDFGIAKVMRGEGSMDPQAPQLTATGQTLGTLEYMSPEQLMGKQLDGRSDVYALGVLAYELITGRLPFPDAKGPAGLITAQLKQTPKPPSQVNPGGNIPPSVDKVLLKCLEKDKNNRFADVTQLSNAAQQALSETPHGKPKTPPPEVLETTRGEPMNLGAPPSMPIGTAQANLLGGGSGVAPPKPQPQPIAPPPQMPQMGHMPPHGVNGPGPFVPSHTPSPGPGPGGSGLWNPGQSYPAHQRANTRWVWLALGLLVLGAVTGAVLAYAL